MNVVVYVIEFEQGERYVGMTEDLDRRLGEHRRRQSPSEAGRFRHSYEGGFRIGIGRHHVKRGKRT